MSEEDLKSQISSLEDDKTKIQEDATKARAAAETEIEAEYDAQIKTAEASLGTESAALDDATEKFNSWKITLAEKKLAVKTLSKEVGTLAKGKNKALSLKLKSIGADEKGELKVKDTAIKGLNKQINALLKQP